MKIAIIGANGQLGSDCQAAFHEAGHEVVPLTHEEIDIADAGSVSSTCRGLQPDVIVNTAAMHNVDACETSPERAFAVNGIGARNLAAAARDLDCVLVHISTDYVFDGSKGEPYTEQDCPRPLNVYGNTKVSGEHFVQAVAPRHFVVRSSGLYGKAPCRAKGGLNFVRLMLKLARERGEVRVVTDEAVSPTYTHDLARQIVALADSDRYGIIHATSQGECSWYEFAQAIFELADAPVRLHPALSSEFPAKVPRPTYSVLANQHLQSHGLDLMPHWRESLQSYLEEIGELGASVPA
ncbi:MAG: dTDP-4-dehydrorhamnose reductase [Gemmatimonadota bacterium]|nr:dTDP-4-dehydrorhamnose reductase [Gemmatimonadota bacterium]